MGNSITFGDYEPEDSPFEEDLKKVSFTFGIFIDGTLNNMKNIEARQAYERISQGHTERAEDLEAASHYNVETGGQQHPQRERVYQDWIQNKPFDSTLAAAYTPKNDSYESELTNVAKLYNYYEEDPAGEHRHRVYLIISPHQPNNEARTRDEHPG